MSDAMYVNWNPPLWNVEVAVTMYKMVTKPVSMVVAAVEDQVPLTQFSHLESLALPVSVEYFPGMHASQTVSNVLANPSASL